jgi:hypothetical protein
LHYLKVVFKVISFIVLFPLFFTALSIKIWYRCSHPEFTIGVQNLKPPHWNRRECPAIKTNDPQLQDLFYGHQDCIGAGARGRVYSISNGKILKYVSLAFCRSLEEATSEFQVGATLDHPNICKLYECSQYTNPSSPHLLFTMDYIDGSTATEIRGRSNYTKDEVIALFRQLQDCCRYLFDQRVLWEDFAPENIMISKDCHLSLIDLGAWKNYEAEKPLSELACKLVCRAPFHVINLLRLFDEKKAEALIDELGNAGLIWKRFGGGATFDQTLAQLLGLSTIDETSSDLELQLVLCKLNY